MPLHLALRGPEAGRDARRAVHELLGATRRRLRLRLARVRVRVGVRAKARARVRVRVRLEVRVGVSLGGRGWSRG